MKTTSLFQLANDLVSAAFNGIYQGMALAALLWIAFKLLRRTNASTRYAAAFLTLLAIAALPIAHLALRVTGHSSINPAPTAFANPSNTASEVAFPTATRKEPLAYLQRLADASPVSSPDKAQAATAHRKSDTTSPPTPLRVHWRTTLPKSIVIGLVCAWFGIAALLVSRLAYQYALLHQLKRRADLPNSALASAFESLRLRVLPAHSVRLLVSDRLSTPLAVGLGNPTVILPTFLCDSTGTDELEGVLLHELAHLSRRDDWTNLVQQILHCALFFHPAVWWISRRLTVDREIACDDHVLAQTRRPKTYALLLTHFAGQRQTQTWAAAPAAWINKNQLKERIGMILDKSRNASPRLAPGRVGSIVAGAFALAIIATLIGPRVALATARPEADALPPVGSESKLKDEFPAHSADESPRPIPAPAPAPYPVSQPSPRAGDENNAVSISDDSRMDLERRVAELQNLVETLVEQRLESHVNVDPHLEGIRDHLEHFENFDGNMPPAVHHKFDFHFDKEAHEHAMKEAERAMEEGVKAYEKAIKNVRAQAKRQLDSNDRQNAMRDERRNALEHERVQLERQLAHLEQQRELLHQQINGLERRLDHLEAE